MGTFVEQRFETADGSRAEQWVGAGYARLGAGSGFEHFVDYRVGDERFSLSSGFVSGTMRFDGRPDRILVSAASAGIDWRDRTSSGVADPRPLLFEPRHAASVRMRETAVRTLALDPAALRRTARMVYGDDRLRVRFSGATPTTPLTASYWMTALELAMEHAAVGSLENDLVRTSVYRAMAIATLEAFRLVGDRRRMRASAVRRLSVYRAGARFLDDFAALPITIDDAAAAASASTPELVDAFLTHDNGARTPSVYLRAVRLGAARDDLRAAEPEGVDTVETIALRWGFPSSRHFARQYGREFGESPRETLWG